MRWSSLIPLIVCSTLLLSPVYAATVTTPPRTAVTNPGLSIKVSTGYANATITMQFQRFSVFPGNNTVQFNVAGLERIQLVYTFTINSFGNGTLTLLFLGIQPTKVTSTSAGVTYDPVNVWEKITYTASQTSVLSLVYGSVTGNIGNAVTLGTGLLVAFMLMIALAFILLVIIKVRQAALREAGEPVGSFLSYPMAFLALVLIFMAMLGLIALFSGYFTGIGV